MTAMELSATRTDADRHKQGIFAPALRAVTIGMLALISILAFEHLAVATVMPLVAQALGGSALYAAAFGAAIAASVVGMVLAGRWADHSGPLPPLWTGVAGFVIGVIAVGAAPNMPLLVLGRGLQGFGGGLMSVTLYVLVGQAFPRRLHPAIFAAFAGAWVLPTVVGPALAGAIAAQWGWRWVFLSAAVLALPAAWLLYQGLPRVPAHDDRGDGQAGAKKPHTTSLWLAGASAVCAALLYAGKPQDGAGLPLLLGLLGVAVCAPRLLPAGTLRARPGLPAVVALRGLAAAAFFAGEVLIPLLLIHERGLSAVQAGLVLTLGALGWSAGSWLQGRAGGWRQAPARARALQAGMAAIAAGLLGVVLVLNPAVPVAVAALAWTLAGAGIGVVYPMLSVLTLECAASDEQGAASSALQLSDALFSAVGLALASALLATLQPWSPAAAYAAAFAAAALLALLGLMLAPRARPLGAR